MGRKRKSSSKSALGPPQLARRETPETPPLIYVTRAKNEKIAVDDLPRPASVIVCGYLADGGHFEALANFRMLYFIITDNLKVVSWTLRISKIRKILIYISWW